MSLLDDKPAHENLEDWSQSRSPTTVEDRGQLAVDEPRHELLLLFGEVHGGGRSFEVGTDPLHLGREVDAEHGTHLRLVDSRASRRHAEIHWSEIQRRHWIRDLGSRNGSHLNGVRIARELLKAGDLIRLGDTVFRFGAAPRAQASPGVSPPFVGRSRSLGLAIDQAHRVAGSGAPVLILGPTGTGKELVAQTIHRTSGRLGPLVAVNCAALPSHLVESELFGHERGAFSGAESARPGVFRAARGGTLFLDEVGELPADVQAKLLRALDTETIRPVGGVAEVPVDVRVVAATNRDLTAEVRDGGFRADLYARLAEFVVALDPLHERPDDLEPLWRHFVSELGNGATIEPSGAAFEAMALYTWPFNVRELRQLVRRALLGKPEGGHLGVEDLPPAMQPKRPNRTTGDAQPTPPPMPLLTAGEVPSKRQLRQLVEEFHGNVKDIASFLGKDRKQIYRWLRRDQIDPDAYRRGGQ